MLCFVDASWPLIGGAFTIDGVDVLWPKKLAERLVPKASVLTPERAEVVLRRFASVFVSA